MSVRRSSVELSVSPTSVTMTSYTVYVVCLTVCTVYSYSIKATIEHNNGAVSEVKGSNYTSGDNWANIRILTLDRLEDAEPVPALTLTNFKSIETLYLKNISLEQVPVFVNTSIGRIYITGNTIKSVAANAFSGPRPWHLDLSNNEIQSMADNSVNMGVRGVYLRCNKLSNFSDSWFEDPAHIRALHLSSNRIEYIQDRAFSQMTQLILLELSYNRITSIGSEAFTSSIAELFLGFNGITRIPTDMFADRREAHMNHLYLHHNQLNYLPEALLLKVKPQHISLFGNPWQCQCLRDIERWLQGVNSTQVFIPGRQGEPGCVVPLSNQNRCVPVVDTELQQTYARALSPVQGCWATPCQCKLEDTRLAKIVYKMSRFFIIQCSLIMSGGRHPCGYPDLRHDDGAM